MKEANDALSLNSTNRHRTEPKNTETTYKDIQSHKAATTYYVCLYSRHISYGCQLNVCNTDVLLVEQILYLDKPCLS